MKSNYFFKTNFYTTFVRGKFAQLFSVKAIPFFRNFANVPMSLLSFKLASHTCSRFKVLGIQHVAWALNGASTRRFFSVAWVMNLR